MTNLLRDLARAKATFQAKTLETIMTEGKPMGDIVERLRIGSMTTKGAWKLGLEAADEIERLRAVPKIKPLVWTEAPSHLDADWACDVGLYQIANCVLFIGHNETGAQYGNDDEAKAAAQADYERRCSTPAAAITAWNTRATPKSIEAAKEALTRIAKWREECHDHDRDMGHDLREFDDEDWRMIECAALSALSALEGPDANGEPE